MSAFPQPSGQAKRCAGAPRKFSTTRLGIAAEIYVVFLKISVDRAGIANAAMLSLPVLLGLWFDYPGWRRAGSSSHLASQTVCRGPKETPVADRATRSAHPRMAARFNHPKQSLANANMRRPLSLITRTHFNIACQTANASR